VKAAIQALTMNRVGDMMLSIGLFAMFALFGNLDYATVFSLSPYVNEISITVIGLLLFIGATAKSAQIPLHVWLPASMEGPTPVSALIHAATLVTAGIYLLLRSSWLLEYSPFALIVIVLIGSITAFFAATSGLVQNDIKRIIAFSTISQLGYMVAAVGLSQYNVALFHLVNHAFFKALLFLSAGQIIHSMLNEQDIRKLGGLINFLPLTYSIMIIGSLSLLATPFLTGFYSKDLIIELAYGQYSFTGTFTYYLLSITAGLTAFYSFRLIMLTFLTVPNASNNNYLDIHESKILVIIPLSLLSIFSIFFGFVFSDLFIGMGSDVFTSSIFILPKHISLIEAEYSLPIYIKLLPAILTIFGAMLAIFLYQFKPEIVTGLTNTKLPNIYQFINFPACKPSLPFTGEGGAYASIKEEKKYNSYFFSTELENDRKKTDLVSPGHSSTTYQDKSGASGFVLTESAKTLYTFLNGKYFFDIIYNHYFVLKSLKHGYNVSNKLERGLIEQIGPYGISNILIQTGKIISKLDTGIVTSYALYIVLGLISLIFVIFSPIFFDVSLIFEMRLLIIYI
jgi:NADH-ubiquinone oxidoreductase chain 5